MKKLIFVLAAALVCFISASGETRHYKMTVENSEIPGDSIVYDIVEPSALDYRTHFIADFLESIRIEKYKNYYVSKLRGTVKAVFLLDENGFVKDTQIVQKSGSGIEYKLVDIFNSAKPISPGYINGKPATFMGQFEMKDCQLYSIRVYWTPLIGTIQQQK